MLSPCFDLIARRKGPPAAQHAVVQSLPQHEQSQGEQESEQEEEEEEEKEEEEDEVGKDKEEWEVWEKEEEEEGEEGEEGEEQDNNKEQDQTATHNEIQGQSAPWQLVSMDIIMQQ